MHRRSLLAAAIAAPLAAPLAGAFAQTGDYPNKPLRLILPFATGGPSDVIARIFANKLSMALKQPVVVLNVPGAGGMIASQQAASAPPDGYTLFYPNQSTLTIAPQISRKPGPEPWTQFAPVAPVLGFALVLVAHPSVPANNLRELVQYAKANPDKLNFASAGIGTTPHLIGEMLKREADIKMVHVAYKGGGPATAAVLAGEVQLFFEQPLTILQHVKAGTIKAITTTSRQRLPFFPNVPTVAEAGLPGLTLESWSGVVVPLATPRPIVTLLSREIATILDSPDMREAIVSRGLEPMKMSPEEFDKLIRTDYPRFTSVIKSQNIVAD